MKDRLFVFFVLALFIPLLAWASAPLTQQHGFTAPEAPAPALDLNDGWTDIFPVPMQDMAEQRPGRDGALDAFDSTLVLDSLEGDYPAWTSADLTWGDYWHLDDTLALGGSGMAWWCGDTRLARPGTAGGYNNHWLQYLVSPALDFSAVTAPQLAFQARWKCETPGGEPAGYDMWDAWNVWGSTDDGATWNVLTPIAPAYTGNSSYAFGEEWGMGTGIPGYAGLANGEAYVACSFDLSSLAGNAAVKVRWAFCSDPAFSTLDDSSMYGLIVDSIRVVDGATTLLSNDGAAGGFTTETGPQAANVWTYDTAEYHTATHSWWAAMAFNSTRAVYSYPVTLPATGYQLYTLRYWVWCDMPDSDGDNNNSLEDYYEIMVSTDGGVVWEQIAYDYGYDSGEPEPGGNSLNGWVLRRGCLTSGGAGQAYIDLTPYAGQTIQIAFRHTTDGNDDGGLGTGLHIDDVQFVATRAYNTDLATRNLIIPFPTTVGLARPYQFDMVNEGLNILGNQLRFRLRFTRPDGTIQGIDSSLIVSGQLQPGADTTVTRNWIPGTTGSHRIRVAANYVGEQDRTNDTTYSPINVPLNADSNLAVTVRAAGEYELGYHLRDLSVSLTNPRLLYFTPGADGVPAAHIDTFDITTIKVMWNYSVDMPAGGARAEIKFYEAGPDGRTPGALINRIETLIDNGETIGSAGVPHWWTMSLAGVAGMAGRSGNFWVEISGLDTVGTEGLPHLLAKVTSPQDTTDGHSFTRRLDLEGTPILASPSRYLVQVTIVPTTTSNPDPVDDVTALRDGLTNNVILSWTPAARANGYYIYRLTNPSHGPSQGVRLNSLPVSGTTYTDVNALANPGVKYFYVVVGIN